MPRAIYHRGVASLADLFRAIAAGDDERIASLLNTSPHFAHEPIAIGASRQHSTNYFLKAIGHYIYAGDTALHIAAAAYRADLVKDLLARGARVGARNRRGAEPLHYAADSAPGSPHWNPAAQSDTIALLIRSGADPNARDNSGVMPLHRAVRTRGAAAVRALLDHGADPAGKNASGSTPLKLARLTTGRGGSGSDAAREQQRAIIELFAALAAK